MLSGTIQCCWVQLSGWHLAAAVALALSLVSWASRQRRKRHDAGGAAVSDRSTTRTRGSSPFRCEESDTMCRARQQNALLTQTKQSMSFLLNGGGPFTAQRQPQSHGEARTSQVSNDIDRVVAIAVVHEGWTLLSQRTKGSYVLSRRRWRRPRGAGNVTKTCLPLCSTRATNTAVRG
jgi:hypothetical protein